MVSSILSRCNNLCSYKTLGLGNNVRKEFELLLSHHPKEEQFKCVQVRLFKKRILLCSRCLGFHLAYFPSLIIFLIIHMKITQNLFIPIIFLLPAITYTDWILTKFKIVKSNNFIRVLTGVSLGIYGAILTYSVLKNPFDIYPYLSAAIFFGIAGIIYFIYRKFKTSI